MTVYQILENQDTNNNNNNNNNDNNNNNNNNNNDNNFIWVSILKPRVTIQQSLMTVYQILENRH